MTTTEKCSCGSDATCSEWRELEPPVGAERFSSRFVVCPACGKGSIQQRVLLVAHAEFVVFDGTVST